MNNADRDLSLDFIKGLAILAVIFLHNLPNYYIGSIAWIGQAIPIFLLVTGYLTYSSFERGKTIKAYYSAKSVTKMLYRIFLPFLIMTIIQFVILYTLNGMTIREVIKGAGIGPGSYYPWLYLQFWLFLPFIIKIIDSLSIKNSIILFITISALLEVLTCFLETQSEILEYLPDTYRVLCYRYLFVVVLGCIAKKVNLKMSSILALLAILSLIFSLIETYLTPDLTPFFTTMWRGYHWSTAFYPLFLFVLICQIYSSFPFDRIKAFFALLGNYSYEIFLCQMFVYSMFSVIVPLELIGNIYIEKVIYIASTTFLSIVPILVYKLWIKKLLKAENVVSR